MLGGLQVGQFVDCWRAKALVLAPDIRFKFRPSPAGWNICEKRNGTMSTANSLAPLIDLMETDNGRSLVMTVSLRWKKIAEKASESARYEDV